MQKISVEEIAGPLPVGRSDLLAGAHPAAGERFHIASNRLVNGCLQRRDDPLVAIDRPRERDAFGDREGQVDAGAAILAKALDELGAGERMAASQDRIEGGLGDARPRREAENRRRLAAPHRDDLSAKQVIVPLGERRVVALGAGKTRGKGGVKHGERLDR